MIPIAKPIVGNEELQQIARALESGRLTAGPIVEEFENRISLYTGYKHAIAVSSGTAALHIIAAALDLKSGDEVVVPDFTFIATANAARYVNAKPVFADVHERQFTLDPESFEKAISPRTKAVIPVSLYGQAYDVGSIGKIAKEKGLFVISDNAQSIGALWKKSHNYGDNAMIFSFYPTKNMTTGEGGAIVTDSDDIAEKCRLWRNIGQRKPYDYVYAGFNYRMPAMNAAMGIAQLDRLPAFTEARRKNASMLNDLLGNVKQIRTPEENPNSLHVYNQYTVLAEKRDDLQKHLADGKIGANIYYPQPLHSLSTFDVSADCPVTDRITKEVLSLPVHPALSENDVHAVAEAVKSFYSGW